MITIVRPAAEIDEQNAYANSRNLTTQTLHLGGKIHSPDKVEIPKDLTACAEAKDALKPPDAFCFKVVVRSNRTAAAVKTGLLSTRVINVSLLDNVNGIRS